MERKEKGRILLLSNEFPPGPGGMGTQAYQLATNLKEFGWAVHVVASQDHASFEEITQFNSRLNLNITSLRSLRFQPVSFLRKLAILLKLQFGLKPSHIISTGHTANFMIFLLRKIKKVKWLAIDHGHLPDGWDWKIKKWSEEEANAVVCVSHFTKDFTERRGIRFKRSFVIHNGADPSDFHELPDAGTKKEIFNLDESATVLLTVGNVSARKGQEVVIRSLPNVLKDYPNVHYCMAGLPTIQKQLMDLAQKLEVDQHVHFLGTLDKAELLKVYNACDIFVMTSRHISTEFEGFGIAVLEAALCGKPAIVSANSGLTEAIEEGITGLTVEENNPEETAGAITRLLRDKELRLQMGRAAKERALKNFSWPEVVRRYEKVLESL